MSRPDEAARRRRILANHPFFRSAEERTLRYLSSRTISKRASRRQAIFEKGDPGDGMYIVVSGALKIVTSLVDAADLTIDVVGPGEVVGEIAMLDGQPRSAGVVALVDTELIFIHRDVFTYFLHQDRKIADEVIRLLCDKVRSTTSYVETSVLLPLPLRLARWLITMARTQGKMLDLDVCEEENRKRTSGMALMMPLSHRDLAEAMGTSRESISRLMSHWQRHGIICTNRGRIVVLLDGALGKYLIDRSGTVQSLDIPS